MGPNIFQLAIDSIRMMMNQFAGFFAAEGLTMYYGAEIIALGWFFCLWMVGEGSVGRLLRLTFLISIGYTMIFFYNSPIPGIGYNFHGLITHQFAEIAHRVTTRQSEMVITEMARRGATLNSPSIYNLDGILAYFLIKLLLLACQLLAFCQVGIGLVAEATMVVIGPLFIPFLILPALDRWFWGWMNSFIQYASYQAIASIVAWIGSMFILPSMNAWPDPMPVSVQVQFLGLMVLELGFYFTVLLMIPYIVNHLWSGQSGVGAGGAVTAAVSRVTK